jgi:hypothetical protein
LAIAYNFTSAIDHVEVISNSKKIIYTKDHDFFMLVGKEPVWYQVKWKGISGSIATFFNTNEKR